MANKTIVMSKLRRVLQLYLQGKSKLFISNYLELSRNTVNKYLLRMSQLDASIDDLSKLSDVELDKLFMAQPQKQPSDKFKTMYKFFPRVDKEIKKPGITIYLLWKEYIKKHPDGIRTTSFYEHYKRWSKRSNPVMHIQHKAGDKMYVDYAGKKLNLVDKETGEVKQVEFFVAILGSSQHTYAEATMSQGKQDFITSVENALHFYGGVPAAIVPDNLKSAVTKSNRYEPTLNETFYDFSEHYATTILPARAYKPRDKSLVEGAVKILYTRIYSIIQKNTYFDLKSLNKAIWKALKVHNNTNLSGRSYSRYQLFKEVEQKELSALPLHRYELKQQSFATVMQNGHVCLGQDKHYYSVPYHYIRKKVKLLYSSRQVEIYYKYNRIAVHKRIKSSYHYTTEKQHLASTHKFMTEWTPERFINWAGNIDPNVKTLISHILQKKQHPEQAYKSCMGVLSLEKKVGKERLINACKRALDYNIYNYKIVLNILEKGLDNMPDEPLNHKDLPKHQNIRGKDYYQ